VLVCLCPCGFDNSRNTLRWKLLQLASICLRIILFGLRTDNSHFTTSVGTVGEGQPHFTPSRYRFRCSYTCSCHHSAHHHLPLSPPPIIVQADPDDPPPRPRALFIQHRLPAQASSQWRRAIEFPTLSSSSFRSTAVIHFTAELLAVARPPWWAPLRPTTPNPIPVELAYRLLHLHRPGDRRQCQRGKIPYLVSHGPGNYCGLSPLQQCSF
jgi:hypothetical protein